MAQEFFSTLEAAKRARISRQTLYTWIQRGLVVAPKPVRVDKRTLRLWTLADVEKLIRVRKQIYKENEGRPRKEGSSHAKTREQGQSLEAR